MNRDTVGIRQLKPWGDPYAMTRGPGYQIDWERTSDYYAGGKFTVKLAAAVAQGDDAITVDALTRGLRAGEKLQAPDVETVLVTVNDADVNATETSITVVALPGPLPSGAVLQFSGAGAGFARLSAPAAEGATSITVEALAEDIDNGATATYQGGEHNLEVLEDVAAGATSVPVGNVQFPIADDTELIAQRSGNDASVKFIPEATVMALDATSKKMFPRHDADDEEAIGLIASDASNSRHATSDSRSGYGTVIGNTFLYENLLPDADTSGDLPAAYKTELAANTLGFTYRDYTDTRTA